MMKPLLSMPSTKACQYLYTDFSIITPPTHPKVSITKLLDYLRNLLKYRLYLSPTDVQELFSIDPTFINTYLHVDSAEELWTLLIGSKNNCKGRKKKGNANLREDDNSAAYSNRLEERQMISLFTKLILSMTKLKNEYANNVKTMDKFAEIKHVIEWLQENIVSLEAEIRDRIKQKAVQILTVAKQVRERQFQSYQNAFKKEIDMKTKQLQNQFFSNQQKQQMASNYHTQKRIKQQMYIHRPSKKLSEAKDMSLLAKLAPYKSEKKRPYQCKTLQNALSDEVEQDKNRLKGQLKRFRDVEQQKIRRKQQKQRYGFLNRLNERNRDALSKLSDRKEQLNRSQQVKLHMLLQQNDKITRQRVNSLRNSLRGYSKRDQTKQINRIMKQHHETIQFVNNIQEIGDTSVHRTIHQHKIAHPRYQTIDIRQHLKNERDTKRYDEGRANNKILRKVNNQSKNKSSLATIDITEEPLHKMFALSVNRKSLANLYDTQLQQYLS